MGVPADRVGVQSAQTRGLWWGRCVYQQRRPSVSSSGPMEAVVSESAVRVGGLSDDRTVFPRCDPSRPTRQVSRKMQQSIGLVLLVLGAA